MQLSGKFYVGLAAAAIAVVGALVVMVWPAGSSVPPSQPGDREASVQNQVEQLESRITDLQRQQRALSSYVANSSQNIAEQVAKLAAEKTASSNSGPSREQGSSAASANPDSTVQHEETLEEAIEKDRQIGAAFEDALVREPIDKSWRNEIQAAIEKSLTNDSLGSPRLRAADCRSSFCKIEVSLKDSDSKSSFLRSLPLVAPFNTQLFVWVKDPSGLEVVAFFSRQGHPLPQIDPSRF